MRILWYNARMAIPEDAKERVEAVLASSPLPDEDKALWRERLAAMSDVYSRMFAELFEENPGDLPIATDRMKRKTAAVQARDAKGIFDILEEEKNELVEDLKRLEEKNNKK